MKKYVYASETPFFGVIEGREVSWHKGDELELPTKPTGILAELVANGKIIQVTTKK